METSRAPAASGGVAEDGPDTVVVAQARVPVHERIALKTALEGVEQGLRPCPACDPKELRVAS